MTTSSAAKKDTQKLQRTIVDALQDVKAQDIVVFDTEHLTSLFERVIVASGTSNRQTKALAASVRDAVREAGFPKPRIEGETNGEWIIVDCAPAVVPIMQPSDRQYYHLEELWGDKPVRLKLGAAKPIVLPKAAATPAKPAAKAASTSLKRSNAAKKGVQEAFPSKAELKKRTAAKAPVAKSARASKPAAQSASASKAVAKPAAKKAVAGKVAAKKTPAKKATSRKA
ncbi:MAG: ribosome silencing factor [Rhodoferax sp.]